MSWTKTKLLHSTYIPHSLSLWESTHTTITFKKKPHINMVERSVCSTCPIINLLITFQKTTPSYLWQDAAFV